MSDTSRGVPDPEGTPSETAQTAAETAEKTQAPSVEQSAERGPVQALPVLLAAATLVVMAGAVISPVITLIRGEFGLSPSQAGVIITLHSLLLAASGPFVGSIIDKVGTKRVMLVGLLGYGVFGAAGAVATSYPMLLGSRVLFGIAAAAVINGMTVSMLNLWQGRARDSVMGYWASANSAGGVIWPVLGGALGALGWRAPFVLYLVALPIAAFAIWLVPDSRAAMGQGGPSSATSTPTPTGPVALLRATPILWWLYALIFVLQLLLYAIVVYVPQRLDQIGVTAPLMVSLYIVVTNLAAGVVGVFYGRIRGRLPYRQIFVLGTFLPVVTFTLLFLGTRPWVLMVATPVFGIGMALVQAAVPVRIGEAVPPAARGRATSYMSSMMLLGQFASPLLLGLLIGPFGVRYAFLGAALISLVTVLAVAAAFRPDRVPTSGRG